MSTFWSEMDSESQSYGCFSEHSPLMVVLERTSFSHDAFWRAATKFCVLHGGDFISTYVLIDARNALLLLVVAHICYDMPHGENKENKA